MQPKNGKWPSLFVVMGGLHSAVWTCRVSCLIHELYGCYIGNLFNVNEYIYVYVMVWRCLLWDEYAICRESNKLLPTYMVVKSSIETLKSLRSIFWEGGSGYIGTILLLVRQLILRLRRYRPFPVYSLHTVSLEWYNRFILKSGICYTIQEKRYAIKKRGMTYIL